MFRNYAATHGVDEAWVLGLVRQESRFNTEARSSAGAAGIMQVMPRTARYVAGKMGMRNYRAKSVTEIETNVTLGPAISSRWSSSGIPSRLRRVQRRAVARTALARRKPIEGAVYIESIPFPETRDYVKKVMANAVYYAAVLDRKPVPLKTRLGVIQPPGAWEPRCSRKNPALAAP